MRQARHAAKTSAWLAAKTAAYQAWDLLKEAREAALGHMVVDVYRGEIIGIDDAIAHRRFLGDAVDAMSRGDRRRAIRRHEAANHRAARFHQLRRNDEIHVPRHGH